MKFILLTRVALDRGQRRTYPVWVNTDHVLTFEATPVGTQLTLTDGTNMDVVETPEAINLNFDPYLHGLRDFVAKSTGSDFRADLRLDREFDT